MYSKQQIVNDVVTHMTNYGGMYKDWYVGVAADPRTMLFIDHGIKEIGDAWISRQCVDDDMARQIEQYFLKRGCQGRPSGADQSTRYFYAYMIQPHTCQ